MRTSLKLATALLAGTVMLMGCSGESEEHSAGDGHDHGDTAMAAVNSMCPMSGEANGDDPTTVDFNGKQVAFCCDDCISDWNNLTDIEKTAKMASLPAEAAEHMDGDEHGEEGGG